MLQPVIRNHDIHPERDELLSAGEAVLRDHHVAAGQLLEQHRLVTHVPPRGFDMDLFRLGFERP